MLEVKEVAPDEFDADFGDFTEFEPPTESRIEETEEDEENEEEDGVDDNDEDKHVDNAENKAPPSNVSSSSDDDDINDDISLSSCSSSSKSSNSVSPQALSIAQAPRRQPFANDVLLHVAPFLSIIQLSRLALLDKGTCRALRSDANRIFYACVSRRGVTRPPAIPEMLGPSLARFLTQFAHRVCCRHPAPSQASLALEDSRGKPRVLLVALDDVLAVLLRRGGGGDYPPHLGHLLLQEVERAVVCRPRCPRGSGDAAPGRNRGRRGHRNSAGPSVRDAVGGGRLSISHLCENI